MNKNNPMRIAINVLHIRPGKCGSHEPYIVNLVETLSELDKDNSYTLLLSSENKHLFRKVNVNWRLIEYPAFTQNTIMRILFEQIILPIHARLLGIDILHNPGNAGSILFPGFQVVTIHHNPDKNRASISKIRLIYFNLVMILNRRVSQLIVPCESFRDEIIERYHFSKQKVQVAYHGTGSYFRKMSDTEISLARKKWEIEEGAILSVTNTLPNKNLPTLIRAFSLLHKKYNLSPQLVLVGYVNQNVLQQIINENLDTQDFLASKIKVIPFIQNNLLPEIYNASSLFVLVSLIESFGMPLTEAMACEIPIVASRIPAFEEILGSSAIFVEPHNPEQIAESMYQGLCKSGLRKALIKNASQRVRAFSWKQTAIKVIEIYRLALKNNQ